MIIGYQSVYDPDFFSAIDFAHENGFDFISFDLNVPRYYIDHLSRQDLISIRTYAAKNNVRLAFHAPGDNISLFSDYPSIRQGILEHFKNIITAAEQLNGWYITLHTGTTPTFRKSGGGDDFLKEYSGYFGQVLYENLAQLCQVSKKVLLCVENYQFTNLTMGVLERLFKNYPIFLTWDIAKTYNKTLNLNISEQDYLLKHLDRIREVHVHDLVKDSHSHQTVGNGMIDFKIFSKVLALPDIAVNIEVRPREEALISRDRLIQILK